MLPSRSLCCINQLFIDKISGDEMGSDAYDYKEVDDIVYELDAQQIVISEGDVDIGGNPSAEEQAEALENGGTQVINIVHSFRLQSTTFDKKGYLTHLKVSWRLWKIHAWQRGRYGGHEQVEAA